MNAQQTRSPLDDIRELQRRLYAALDPRQETHSSNAQQQDRQNGAAAVWAPLVDISEDEQKYLIAAELPEVKKGAVKITVENGILIIRGERKPEPSSQGSRLHRSERPHGSFERSFTLPDDANTADVRADFKDGVLRIHVAKAESARARQIEVKAG